MQAWVTAPQGGRLAAIAATALLTAAIFVLPAKADTDPKAVLANYAAGRLIFNLGHGIQPETPITHVEQMIRRVRDRQR